MMPDDAEAAGTTTATGPVERVSPEIAELSSDPYSYQFSLDGVNFQLPCYVADLQAAGFMLEAGEAGDILEGRLPDEHEHVLRRPG